ncbi:Cys-tRNA(Pro) deacylase [Virgibacillus sp. 179-BFC.A HS]|uniref:Cys-tRNA(Pro)/Cys-tRNA(Cys) deacylase n=1 Tax=Tigheibacillus jepli TaxID=3035914 RepID=A0ABU5CL73_9BACI|nr:Cys-tRNA(Pro) deacylase [Virgibacillus sp. 179-BFC.A HS]MDY0406559.1 Cys-tRNA(Pro) deacylase [Virgibacillus sp. 179-BFC.A HS]
MHKTNAIRILDKEQITYRIHEYPWSEEHLDAVTAAEKVGMPCEKVFKTLVATGDKTGVIVGCIPAENELDLKSFAKVSGNKKVEMLAMKELENITGYIRGGCSPIGMKKRFPTYVASAAVNMDTIVISAGKRGLQIEISPADLQQVTDAVFADITVS